MSNQKTLTTSNKDVTSTISLIAQIPVVVIIAPSVPQCVNSVLAGGQYVSQHWLVGVPKAATTRNPLCL